MANALVSPAAVLGLMGRQSPLRSFGLMGGTGATEEERRRRELEQAALAQQQQMAAQQPAQRERVSGWNVLGRVLAPETFGAIDDERTRLQAEAERPQRNARIQDALSSITDPRERALFLGMGSEDWQKNIGQQFAPQVVAEGAAQRIAGSGDVYNNRRTREFGDSLVRDTANGYETLGTRGPTIAEQAAQDRLAWDQQYGGQRLNIDQQQADTGRMNAETTQANSGFTISQGQQRRAPDGSLIAASSPAPTAASAEQQGRWTALNTDVVPVIGRMETLLNSGDVITGFGAQARLQAARALAATGNADARRQVAATEEFVNTSGRLRVGMAKSLGANPSNADIALLERVTAGDIGQSRDGLLATIRQGRELTDRQMQALQSQTGGQAQTGGARPRARNPQTGQVVELVDGAWVPVQ